MAEAVGKHFVFAERAARCSSPCAGEQDYNPDNKITYNQHRQMRAANKACVLMRGTQQPALSSTAQGFTGAYSHSQPHLRGLLSRDNAILLKLTRNKGLGDHWVTDSNSHTKDCLHKHNSLRTECSSGKCLFEQKMNLLYISVSAQQHQRATTNSMSLT